MADQKLYEDKLTEAIKETAITNSKVKKYANALIQQEDLTFVNIHASNTGVSKHIKQILTD